MERVRLDFCCLRRGAWMQVAEEAPRTGRQRIKLIENTGKDSSYFQKKKTIRHDPVVRRTFGRRNFYEDLAIGFGFVVVVAVGVVVIRRLSSPKNDRRRRIVRQSIIFRCLQSG
uniref:Uncharacterized protein n=1 Tax=Romanomermis culicivorax TaxID=13658 RepID=A0A915J8N4_ROMCU